MLIQLLPSSTVAAGVRLNSGLGTVASAMPGGTFQVPAANSGGIREPLQYWLTTVGLLLILVVAVPFSDELVNREYVGASLIGVVPIVLAALPGPVSPRMPRSQ